MLGGIDGREKGKLRERGGGNDERGRGGEKSKQAINMKIKNFVQSRRRKSINKT